MKRIILILTIFITTSSLLQAQNRVIARGAEPGELYLTTFWCGIYSPSGPPYYDTLRLAVYRISDHGQNVTIQYDVDYFSDLFTPPGSVMQPLYILADATPGVLYTVRKYSKNYYTHTQLWVSFDYGKNWIFREENIGNNNYITANVDGSMYRAGATGTDGTYKSNDYAMNFVKILDQTLNISEHGLEECEFHTLSINAYYHTNDCYQNYMNVTIQSEYASGGMPGFFPDVYRGNIEGEVFIHSWFPWYNFRVSFSDNTAQTFKHVYVNNSYQWQNSLFDKNQLLFMSDREPGVFYILNLLQEQDVNPVGFHLKLCIHYYRDYGETLVDVYCHDLNKNYLIETCEAVTDLSSEKPDNNSVFLTWSMPESDLTVEGYRVYRNHKPITEQLIIDTLYLDENLDFGVYEYNVLTFYTTGCISEISNFVSEFVEQETCEAVTDLVSEKVNENNILLNWSNPESDLQIEGYRIYRNNTILINELILDTTYLDENLPNGTYNYYVITHYANGCISDTSNHVEETIELGINEFADEIVIYPNPSTDELIIDNGQLIINEVELFDIFGRKQNSSQFSILNSQFKIDISYLQTGLYFIKITTEKGIITQKIIKY